MFDQKDSHTFKKQKESHTVVDDTVGAAGRAAVVVVVEALGTLPCLSGQSCPLHHLRIRRRRCWEGHACRSRASEALRERCTLLCSPGKDTESPASGKNLTVGIYFFQTVTFFFFLSFQVPSEKRKKKEGISKYLLSLEHDAVPLLGGGKLHRNRAHFQGQPHRYLVNLLLVGLFIALPKGIAIVTKELILHLCVGRKNRAWERKR